MKKVAVVSCYFIRNYGSVLQAYATEKYLKKQSVQCQTLCTQALQPLLWKKKKEYYRQNRHDFALLSSKLPLLWLRLLEKLNWRGIGAEKRSRLAAFDRFITRFSLTEEKPADFQALTGLSAQFDTVLLGSDQLWRPDNMYPGFYTLEWVQENVKKVSFATSFGVAQLDGKSAERAARFLPRFSAISVREKNGCDIVKKVSGKDALQACDPVFLLDREEWSALADESACPKEKYVVCYFLGKGKGKIKKIVEICRKKGLKAIVIPNLDRYESAVKGASVCNASPEQFLGLVKNAQCVFSDSFHASAFAVLFGRRLCAFRRSGEKKHSTDSRIVSFLELANKTACLAQSSEESQLLSRLEAPLEREIHPGLLQEIEKTKAFLEENLFSEVKNNG